MLIISVMTHKPIDVITRNNNTPTTTPITRTPNNTFVISSPLSNKPAYSNEGLPDLINIRCRALLSLLSLRAHKLDSKSQNPLLCISIPSNTTFLCNIKIREKRTRKALLPLEKSILEIFLTHTID